MAGDTQIDQTTVVSLLATVALLSLAYFASLHALPRATTTRTTRALFIWHAFDALTHFILEGSFLWHCLFTSSTSAGEVVYPTAKGYLFGAKDHLTRAWGPQAAGGSPLAELWMVYARADRRWAGADLDVVSIELLTVLVCGPLAVLVCTDLARRSPRANILMIILATAEIYGGFMTFSPEWLTGSPNLDTDNWMHLWVFLIFFNGLWVVLPLWAIAVACGDITDAFAVRSQATLDFKAR